MNKIHFAMGLHFHQPVGNFPHVLEKASKFCYRPFLELAEKYPDIKFTVHFSGCLLDYFEKDRPDLLEIISRLIKRGQVEIMGGGYYEPIFTAIPDRDKIGQIDLTRDYLKQRFGVTPRGLWIPERVWSPDLAVLFQKAGLKYSILDDMHFIKAGVDPDKLYGYYLTTHKNAKLAIFPSLKKLRYDIPFKSPHETIDYIKKEAQGKTSPLFTYGDDGEKFGMWPGTNKLVYEDKWLERFFEELIKNRDSIETIKFSEFIDQSPPLGEIVVPETSYEEMLEWAGGPWKNFLFKYPESNHMHKKMLYVSEKINQTEKTCDMKEKNTLLKEARNNLYKGQCNCSYWHGLFGGIYLYHLRKATYECLINADRIMDAIIHEDEKNWMDIEKKDFYRDKTDTYIIENNAFSLYLDPLHGGIIRELDYKPGLINLVNTLGRRRETYHSHIKSLPGEERSIFYDKHIKGCLIDHFFEKEITLNDFINSQYEERGDFADSVYSTKKNKDKIALTCNGAINGKPFSISKNIHLEPANKIRISYVLKNTGKTSLKTIFGVEFNVTMPYANSDRYTYNSSSNKLGDLNRDGVVRNSGEFAIKNSEGQEEINFKFSLTPQDIWYFPLRTISQSESNFELNYQSSCLLPRWDLEIIGGQEVKFDIIWAVS